MGNVPCHASRMDFQKADTITVKNRRYVAEDGVSLMIEKLQYDLASAKKHAHRYRQQRDELLRKIKKLEDSIRDMSEFQQPTVSGPPSAGASIEKIPRSSSTDEKLSKQETVPPPRKVTEKKKFVRDRDRSRSWTPPKRERLRSRSEYISRSQRLPPSRRASVHASTSIKSAGENLDASHLIPRETPTPGYSPQQVVHTRSRRNSAKYLTERTPPTRSRRNSAKYLEEELFSRRPSLCPLCQARLVKRLPKDRGISHMFTFPLEKHRRGSYILFNTKLDANSVWQSELAPRKFLNDSNQAKGDSKKKEKARRRSLAVYTNRDSCRKSEIEIRLDDSNAERYVHLTPVYAFKIAPEQAGNIERALLGQTSNEPSPENLKSPKPVYSRFLSVEENAGLHHANKTWLVIHIKNSNQNRRFDRKRPSLDDEELTGEVTINVFNDIAFHDQFSAIDEFEHRFAKVASVHAVPIRQEARIRAYDSQDKIIEAGEEEKSGGVPPTISLPSMAKLTLGLGSTKSLEIGHESTKGSPGDFLVQDKEGHQWFVKPDTFKAFFQRQFDFTKMSGSYQTLDSQPFSRYRKLFWTLRRPKQFQIAPPVRPVAELLSKIHTWDYDIFKLSDLTMRKPLYHTGYALFQKWGLFDDLPIDQQAFKRFLVQAETAYLNNPYHNSMHGADVCQAAAHFLQEVGKAFPNPNGTENKYPLGMTALEVLALLLSSLVHDIGHPGSNNAFQIATGSQLAICYNDRSVLENFHAAEAFSILQNPEYNFLKDLDNSSFRSLRQMVVELVLATDLEHHRDIIHEFEMKCKECAHRVGADKPTEKKTNVKETAETSDKSDSEQATNAAKNNNSRKKRRGRKNSSPDEKDSKESTDKQARAIMHELVKTHASRLTVLKVIIKCSDINHPSRPLHLHKKWCELIQEEFFQQGDLEAAYGLPVSRGMDRKASTSVTIANGNVGFIKFIVSPLFNIMTTRLRNPLFSQNIEKSFLYWKKQSEKPEKKRSNTTPSLPSRPERKERKRNSPKNSPKRRRDSGKLRLRISPPVFEEDTSKLPLPENGIKAPVTSPVNSTVLKEASGKQ